MVKFFVGVGQVTLLLRYARSLKDKRIVVHSLIQKLKNRGFSVIESGDRDQMKQAVISFAITAREEKMIHEAFDSVMPLFWGHEIVEKHKELVEFFSATAGGIPT